MTDETFRASSLRRRITTRLRAISTNALDALAHEDPASDTVADLLTWIADDLAIVQDRINDLRQERAQPTAARPDIVLCEIAEVANVYDPGKPWVLRWQTSLMAAPSFTYFATAEEAEAAADATSGGRR
jgi:hypothetical protein